MTRLSFIGFGGVRLAADGWGSPGDPAVLLVPGWGQTREVWHGCAQALAAAGRYAITIDRRGHGDSDHAADGRYDLDAQVGDLKAILSDLPTRACVVAGGLGSITAIAAVGESAPHLVSGLALVDTTVWFDANLADRNREAFARRARGFDDLAAVTAAIAAAYPNEPTPAATDRMLAGYERGEDGRFHWRGDPLALLGIDVVKEQERLQAAVGRIAAPVVLIRGALNETITGEVLQRLEQLIPGAETAEIEGAGHYSPLEREDEFNAVLLDFLERRAPRQPLAYVGGSEPRTLRDALGCFGTGVTVVTTMSPDGPIGLTANSFTSVSLDPPLILFSLAGQSASLAAFDAAGRFAVNVLQIGQQPLANRFAQRGHSRFEGVDWEIRVDGGSPIFPGSLASFDCDTYAVHEGGDHRIYIGRVHHAWFEPHRDPLLYFRGKYRRLHFD